MSEILDQLRKAPPNLAGEILIRAQIEQIRTFALKLRELDELLEEMRGVVCGMKALRWEITLNKEMEERERQKGAKKIEEKRLLQNPGCREKCNPR